MIKYSHVEDYIELLAGYEPNAIRNALPLNLVGKFINLARYDNNIVDNMAHNTLWGTPLTDRQAALACKLILKYRRQFASKGIDVSPIENPKYRIPIRSVDRTRSIECQDQIICIKFPFDQNLIEELRNLQSSGKGHVKYNRITKVWELALTEWNLNFAVALGEAHHFEICPTTQKYFADLLACESQVYEIKLIRHDTGFKITNAEHSLIEYINNHGGGFAAGNEQNLIDLSGWLGYAVADDILADTHPSLRLFGTKYNSHIVPATENLEKILEYAKITQRYPICILDSVGTIDLNLLRPHFSQDEIIEFDHNGKTKTREYDTSRAKIVYARKIPKDWNSLVPLMITTIEMIYGARKSEWTQRAEKIIYYTNTQLRDSA